MGVCKIQDRVVTGFKNVFDVTILNELNIYVSFLKKVPIDLNVKFLAFDVHLIEILKKLKNYLIFYELPSPIYW